MQPVILEDGYIYYPSTLKPSNKTRYTHSIEYKTPNGLIGFFYLNDSDEQDKALIELATRLQSL